MQYSEPKSEEQQTLKKLIDYHTVDVAIGAIGIPINICLLAIFFSKRSFFRQNMMFVVLAFGDFSACLGILSVGLSRRNLYSSILETDIVPVESPWTCAQKPFVWFRLLGSILQSSAVFWIGVERLLAVCAPIFYRDNLSKKKSRPCVVVIFYAIGLSILAFLISYSHRNQPAIYYCGRKAAFGNEFSTYIYAATIGGYLFGLFFNLATFITLCRMYSNRSNISEIHRQLRILRYVVLISLISTIAITIPNLVSLFTTFYGRTNISVSESGSWLLGIKSFINIFIYLALKTDFRDRLLDILGLQVDESIQPSESPKYKKQLSVPKECLHDSAETNLLSEHEINC